MISLAYGMPGAGKTLWMHDYMRAAENAEQRFFVVNRADEWAPDAIHWRGKPPKNLFMLESVEEVDDSELESPGVYVFNDSDENPLAIAQKVIDIGNATFVDDELDFSGTRDGWRESPLRKITHQGRHLKNQHGDYTACNILGACRRPQSLHPDLTALPAQVCIFQVQGDLTLERLKQDSMIDAGDWATVATLPKFHFLHWPSRQYFRIEPIGEENRKSTRGDRRDMTQMTPQPTVAKTK